MITAKNDLFQSTEPKGIYITNWYSSILRIDMIILLLSSVILMSSCVSSQNLVTFEKDEREITDNQVNMAFDYKVGVKPEPYKIKSFDQLQITINGYEGDTRSFLNKITNPNANQAIDYNTISLYQTSYLVSEGGTIDLPLVGLVSVKGNTTEEISTKVTSLLKSEYEIMHVLVKLANARVTILGEVESPGSFDLTNDRVTILDVLGLSGGLTNFADRTRVRVIRQLQKGQEIAYVDLSSSAFIESEYFYVKPDDIIYVKPGKARALQSSSESLGVVLSSISLAAVILSLFIGNKN